jgi:hypothetical protein
MACTARISSRSFSGSSARLTATKAQLEEHYAKVGALLNRRYFTH